MSRPHAPLSSHQPDLRILDTLEILQRTLLPIVLLVAGVVMLAWFFSPIAAQLPSSWDEMRAITATSTLLSCLSLYLSRPRRSSRSVLISRYLGVAILVLAVITICEHAFSVSLGIDHIFVNAHHTPPPGPMSVQTSVCFVLVGFILTSLRARKQLLAKIVDSVTLMLCLIMLVFIAAYMFKAMDLFGLTPQNHLSIQTLFCLVLLSLMIVNRRTEFGSFSILIDNGIGGKTARMGAPLAVFAPFTMAFVRGAVTKAQLIPEQYSVAITSGIMAIGSFCFILFLSRRCKSLETETRELSLRDQLTQLYNRRGFYLLAEQGLRIATRAREEFFLLFIDMDNLKIINDSLGHEAGSELIGEMGRLITDSFRETDIVGRLGGDEFVVAGNGGADDLRNALARLDDYTARNNAEPGRTFPLSFSRGFVTTSTLNTESLQDLLHRADVLMYEAKRTKKLQRQIAYLHESPNNLPASSDATPAIP